LVEVPEEEEIAAADAGRHRRGARAEAHAAARFRGPESAPWIAANVGRVGLAPDAEKLLLSLDAWIVPLGAAVARAQAVVDPARVLKEGMVLGLLRIHDCRNGRVAANTKHVAKPDPECFWWKLAMRDAAQGLAEVRATAEISSEVRARGAPLPDAQALLVAPAEGRGRGAAEPLDAA